MKICLLCEGVSETTQERCATCGRPLLDTQAVHFPRRRGEEDAANPLLGTVVDGKYRIHNVLGKGGMGTVFQATHAVSLVPVALKILNPRFSARREYREYFLAEAQKAGRVIHEHTARILDVGEGEDGTVYIAMEIVNGITLHECIYGETPLAPAQVVDVLLQICDALSAAHQAGLVHRDLSTRNVMVVSRQGEPFVKILDFGIAKGLPMLKTPSGGAPVAPVGFASPPYTAPEQLEGRNVDARADLYSLGVIGYEALARRLPVQGTSGQELAEATLRGELLPLLDPPPGTTHRLVRLLQRLMARDPDRRPASALAVHAELRRIRHPGSPRVRGLALVSFVIAVVLMTLAFGVPQERQCVIQPGSIEVTAPGLNAEEQVIQSTALAHLRFDYAGFRAGDIVVEIQRGDRDEPRRSLSLPAPEAAGGIVDLAPTPAALEQVRRELREASRNQAVDLIFRWRDRPPFGIARLRIDDDAPEVRLEPSPQLRDNGVLSAHAECFLSLQVTDQSPVTLALSCYDLSDGQEAPKPFGKPISLDPGIRQIQPFVLLGAVHEGPKASGPIGLEVAATDAAGNRGVSQRLAFAAMDFKVPEISSRQVFAAHDERCADILLEVNEVEPDLKAWIMPAGEQTPSLLPAERRGPRQLLIKLPKPATGGFVSGDYQIRLQDRAGNTSPELAGVEIVFRNIHADVRFDLGQRDPRTGALRMVQLTGPEQLVWDGRDIALALTCNPLYQPRSVRLPRGEAMLLDAESGKAHIRLGAVEDGSYELELGLGTSESENAQLFRVPLVVVREPLVLHVGGAPPGAGSSRYLEGLSRNMFARDSGAAGHPVLRQGPSWNLSPDLPGLVRGSVLTGSSLEDLVPVTIGKLLPQLEVRIGRNLVYLDLHDVLQRPVLVQVAGGSQHQGRCRIADFYYFKELARPRSTEPAIQLEAGQDARLVLDSPYPFTSQDEDKIVLQFPGVRPIPARLRPARGEGAVLEFVLPYSHLRLASLLDDEELRHEGRQFQIAPDLQTPAGKQPLNLLVRTIRSALTSRSLGALFAAAPKPLADIVMVPVLSPRREFEDPVSGAIPGRGKFRPQPPIGVRNIRDCYLQDGELTRQQYQCIVTRALSILPATESGWRQLVFPADPEGRDRLRVEGMVPAVHREDTGAWQQRLRTGPDRPVTGVNFYQAYAVTRLAGWLLGRDPDLFRLPMGVEMELAALGTGPSPGRLNGCSAGSGSPTYADHRSANRGMASASWPPTRSESKALGDQISGPLGTLVGLDYGVREWVLDLPWLEHAGRGTIRILMSDHARHLRAATSFLEMDDLQPVRKELRELGVVRGLALGEVALLQGPPGSDGGQAAAAVLPPSVPGVVRTLHMRRDGAGVLLDELDPHLAKVGLRLCGGVAFIAEVRRR